MVMCSVVGSKPFSNLRKIYGWSPLVPGSPGFRRPWPRDKAGHPATPGRPSPAPSSDDLRHAFTQVGDLFVDGHVLGRGLKAVFKSSENLRMVSTCSEDLKT